MELISTKIVTLVILLISTLLFGLFPIVLIRTVRRREAAGALAFQSCLSLINCFAGGVFMATTLLHMLPEVREDITAVLGAYNIDTNFAVSEFIVAYGFFIILVMENIVMVANRLSNGVPKSVSDDTLPILHPSGNGQCRSYGTVDGNAGARREPALTVGDTGALIIPGTGVRHGNHSPTLTTPGDGDSSRRLLEQDGGSVYVTQPLHHQHAHHLAGLRSFILLLALSVHTIFEGLAIGLQPTSNDVWQLFIAIVIHKSVIAFSMGIQFAESLRTYCRGVIFVVVFAIMSPLGILIGLAIFGPQASGHSSSSAASAVLQAVATGTFLYVTFFEVLYKEVGEDHCLLKVLAVIFGFTTMVLLNLFNGEPH